MEKREKKVETSGWGNKENEEKNCGIERQMIVTFFVESFSFIDFDMWVSVFIYLFSTIAEVR